jgi:uncharacterized membrane protein (DUF2068 family)
VATSRSDLLPWIVAFKAFKALTLTALGLTLLVERRADPVDLLVRLALAVHLPVTSRLFERALTFAMNLTVGKETAIAFTAFGGSALMGTEGIALHLRKPWARWFTIIATGALIPVEVYETLHELDPLRALILMANVAVVVYLARRREVFEASPAQG